MMDLRYVYNDQPVAEGGREIQLVGGRLFVRTGIKSVDLVAGEITYRLREVYDANKNRPPAGGNLTLEAEVAAP